MTAPPKVRHSATTASFSCFSRLPAEVRIMIWKEALPDSRIVYVEARPLLKFHCRRVWSNCATDAVGTKKFFGSDKFASMADRAKARKPGFPVGRYGFRPLATPITLLYVCRESFAAASTMYSRILGTQDAFPETWIDVRRDILYIDSLQPWVGKNNRALILDVEKVENIAVRCDCGDQLRHSHERDELLLSKFLERSLSVKTVTILHEGSTSERKPLVVADSASWKFEREYLFRRGLDRDYDRGADKSMNASWTHNRTLRERRPGTFSTKLLNKYRTAGLENGQAPRFELPTVKYATVIALDTKVELDWLLEDYLRKKDRYRTKLRVRSTGREELKLAAAEMMTMREVVKEFCHSRNLSNSAEHARVVVDGQELDPELTVYDLDLRSGVKLDIVLD